MVLRRVTRPWRGMLKYLRNNNCIVTAESPFFKQASAMKELCLAVHYSKTTKMAWNQLATDRGCITSTHTIVNTRITGLKNRQVFLPHPVLIVNVHAWLKASCELWLASILCFSSYRTECWKDWSPFVSDAHRPFYTGRFCPFNNFTVAPRLNWATAKEKREI
jgi:hypothetical protein